MSQANDIEVKSNRSLDLKKATIKVNVYSSAEEKL
jgi:hypothetical protein